MAAADRSRTGTRWRVFGSRTLYKSRWVNLDLVDVETPSGVRFEHHVLRMQRVAVVLLVDDSGQLLMLHRHRFIDDSWGWELPVGIVEPSEDPASAAIRELREETGWGAQEYEQTLTFQPAIGIADTEHFVFVARGAVDLGPATDLDEADDVSWVPRDRLLSMVDEGIIRDGASLVAVLHLLASGRGT
jgi:8-oxo-dGTP pyrophosphatase MutT (NUDIX family)